MEEIVWARIGLALVVMVAASVTDWRTRTASDLNWAALGVGGAALFAWELWTRDGLPIHYLCLALMTLVFIDLLRDRPGIFEDGFHPAPLVLYVASVAAYAYLSMEHFNQEHYWTLVTVPSLIILFFILYQFDVIKGGADAKALIALSFCFPSHPVIEGLPLLQIDNQASMDAFPFPLLVLFNGAILTLLVPLGMFIINLARRDLAFPQMFLGRRMDIEEARSKHVWPMVRVEEGRARTVLFPRSDEEEDWDGLRAAGVDRPWVTPKVPFLIPLTLALPFSLLVGNILLYLMGA